MFDLFKKRKKQREPFGYTPAYCSQSELVDKYKGLDNKLFKKNGKCRPFDKKIKLLIFADTHGHIKSDPDYNLNIIPDDIDICLLLGDISRDDIAEILKHVPKEKIIGILGNHDYDTNLEVYDIPNINKTMVEINGVKISGIEGCIKYKDTQPGYTLTDGFSTVKTIPAADICITHAAPFGILGLEHNTIHIGAPYINDYLYTTRTPINICGHNHVDYVKTLSNGTTIIGTYKQRIIEIDHNEINSLY